MICCSACCCATFLSIPCGMFEAWISVLSSWSVTSSPLTVAATWPEGAPLWQPASKAAAAHIVLIARRFDIFSHLRFPPPRRISVRLYRTTPFTFLPSSRERADQHAALRQRHGFDHRARERLARGIGLRRIVRDGRHAHQQAVGNRAVKVGANHVQALTPPVGRHKLADAGPIKHMLHPRIAVGGE